MADALLRVPGAYGVPHAMTAEARDELRARAEALLRAPEWAARAGRAQEPSEPVEGTGGLLRIADGIGVIAVRGPLYKGGNGFDDWMMSMLGGTSYDNLWRALEAAGNDQAVRGILLRCDSPGGEVTGCGELADFIWTARKRKPIWTYVEGLCASACEWLTSQTDRVVAHHTGLIGWIGVIRTMVDVSAAQEKFGVKEIEIVSKQSPDKRSIPMDDAVLARAQTIADDLADRFIFTVARGRGADASDVQKRFGAGDGMIASKALAVGLIDAVGDLNSTLEKLRAATLGADTVITPPRPAPAARSAARPLKEKPMATKSNKHRAESDDKKKDSDAKRAEAAEHEGKAKAKRADADAKRAEAKSKRAEAEKDEKDGENAKAKAKRAEADKCDAEAEQMDDEAAKCEEAAKAARAEADEMDKDHDEPDGDEDDKKALSALSGLAASASIAAHTAAIEAKMVPRASVTALEKRLADLEADRQREKDSAEAKRLSELADAAGARGYFAGLEGEALAKKRERFIAIAKREPEAAREIIEALPASQVAGRLTSGGNPVGGKHSDRPKIDAFDGAPGAGVRRVNRGDVDVLEVGSPDLMSRAQAHQAKHGGTLEEAMVKVVKDDPAIFRS